MMLCIAVEVLAAIMIQGVADVVGFLGAAIGTLMMLVVPALVLNRCLIDTFSRRARLCITLLFSVCAGLMLLGTMVMIPQDSRILPLPPKEWLQES